MTVTGLRKTGLHRSRTQPQSKFTNEGEKSFVLTMSEADEVKPHTGEDVHHVPHDVKVKTKSDLIMRAQQMNKHLFAGSTCDIQNKDTDQVTNQVTRNNVRDGSVSDVEQQ
ncbi:hypothetical protein AMTR_s00017p00218990 [Amborella trichopoda]|uniref:Uncharacterized protein n=1 Tax=Amborella trichopoda TaxID=13333 RepID=W1PLZ4_AMBTC|nr:hypothetical protein AMTR_s00017p00218990 [Amborella trichopoda]